MILADDNFATIVDAVREGRVIFDNIRKFLRYLLSSNMGEVLTVFLGVVAGRRDRPGRAQGEAVVLPLLATQILWINLITDSGPALAMGVDPQTDDVMARKPRRLTERVIDARMWAGVVEIGAGDGGGDAADDRPVPARRPDRGQPRSRQRAHRRLHRAGPRAAVQLLQRPFGEGERVRHLFVNRWLWGAVALSVLLQVAVVHVGFLNVAFGTVPLTPDQWLACVAMASVVLWVSELRKVAMRVTRT